MITVRQTTNLDIVSTLDSQIFFVEKPVNTTNSVWWVAWDGDKPVGFAGIRQLKDEPYAYLLRAGVLKSHRGLGIHKKLIKVRLNWAKRNPDIQGVLTYTVAWNIPSSNNLINAGFKLFKPGWAWVGTKDVLYWYYGFEDSK